MQLPKWVEGSVSFSVLFQSADWASCSCLSVTPLSFRLLEGTKLQQLDLRHVQCLQLDWDLSREQNSAVFDALIHNSENFCPQLISLMLNSSVLMYETAAVACAVQTVCKSLRELRLWFPENNNDSKAVVDFAPLYHACRLAPQLAALSLNFLAASTQTQEMCEMLHSVPKLRWLDVFANTNDFWTPALKQLSVVHPCTALTQLSLGGGSFDDKQMRHACQMLEKLPCLRMLDISCIDSDAVSVFADFFRRAFCPITTLVGRFTGVTATDLFACLARNTRLHTFKIYANSSDVLDLSILLDRGWLVSFHAPYNVLPDSNKAMALRNAQCHSNCSRTCVILIALRKRKLALSTAPIEVVVNVSRYLWETRCCSEWI